MSLELWLTFAFACVIFSIAPGAGMVITVSNSISGGLKTAVKNILGLQLALLTHILIVSAGLGALLATSALAFTILKYIGAAYLLYLGFSKFFSKVGAVTQEDALISQTSNKNLIWKGFVVNMMNPKSIVFLAAFLPQFLNPALDLVFQYIALGSTVLIIDLAVMCSYALLASLLKPYLVKSSFVTLQNKVFGSLFIAMGVFLARAEQSTR
ncbi:MAG: homoserine/homoserine lactone efflux protein [Psychromonas sp.]|jgi:homoserine/homoserine lactone efflux protein|uniref:LysE family transporter n=1 Tax=Psychromonas sp. TaxID=1884585 RepID=UPI0039E62F97